MNEYAGVSEWTGGIPVELPVDAVRRYVQGENITYERFNLLKDYFEARIIKLLESKLQHDRLAEIDKSAATMNLQIRLMVELIKGGNK